MLDVAYVGTTGTHLPRFRQIDQAYITQAQVNALTNPDIVTRMNILGIPPPAQAFLLANIEFMPSIIRGPYFGFAQIFEAEDSMSSNYNALQVKVDKQLVPRPDLRSRLHLFEVHRRRLRLFRLRRKRQHHLSAE